MLARVRISRNWRSVFGGLVALLSIGLFAGIVSAELPTTEQGNGASRSASPHTEDAFLYFRPGTTGTTPGSGFSGSLEPSGWKLAMSLDDVLSFLPVGDTTRKTGGQMPHPT